MQDPLPHIIKHNLAFQCAVHKEKSAELDSSTLRHINWEVFLLSDSDAVREFDSDPLKYCGILTDPVTRQRFIPDENSPMTDFDHRRFYFWTEESKEAFEKMPGMYYTPNYRMKEFNNDSENSTP